MVRMRSRCYSIMLGKQCSLMLGEELPLGGGKLCSCRSPFSALCKGISLAHTYEPEVGEV